MVEHLLILAGGDGTRLKEVAGVVSKPLITLGDERVITKIIKKLVEELKVIHIYLLVQEKHLDQYVEYVKSPEIREYSLQLVVEKTKLGTGGAIKNFLHSRELAEFYVSNADTIIKSNISDFINAKPNSILCTSIAKNDRFGSIDINSAYKITKFNNTRNNQSGIVNLGIYKLKSEIFTKINDAVFDIESVVFPYCAANGILNCFMINAEFEDIGIPEAYFRELQNERRKKDNGL